MTCIAERVETAPQMRAALEKQAWDAIIADYHLPQFDAPAALAVLRDTGLDIPFIVVSGAVGEDRAVAMMKAGAHDYLMKSNLLRLVPAVEREIQEATVRRERKLADEALRTARRETERSHQLLDAVFNAQMDAVLVYNTAGAVIRANPAASAIFGFDPTGMGNAAILEKLQIPAGAGQERHPARAGGRDRRQPGADQPADRTFETSSLPMRDAAGQIIGAVTIMRDISERKRAEQRLQHAQKLESIALLAGGIAHDFNNILTVVSGNISLAMEESCPDCEARSILPAALESVERAACLTRQLLAYAGKGAFVRQPVSVSGRRRAGRCHASSVAARENPPGRAISLPICRSCLMDPGQMEQVFSNLILNAVEAIPEWAAGNRHRPHQSRRRFDIASRSPITVAASTRKPRSGSSTRSLPPNFQAGARAGCRRGNRSHAGRPDRGRQRGRGRHSHRGGSARSQDRAARARGGRARDGFRARCMARVLIVDDEPMIRKMAAAFLKKRGIPVLEAANGKEAIERLTGEGGAVRAILLDMAMPEMPGRRGPAHHSQTAAGRPGDRQQRFPGPRRATALQRHRGVQLPAQALHPGATAGGGASCREPERRGHMNQPLRVLLIEDSESDAALIVRHLENGRVPGSAEPRRDRRRAARGAGRPGIRRHHRRLSPAAVRRSRGAGHRCARTATIFRSWWFPAPSARNSRWP